MTKNVVRCAIYTRKSTEEGLDQDFNSLQAQREAAEAFILSQKHLGWVLIRDRFDDGGFSGGSLERPALQKLLEGVDGGRVDCIVVYKVDRLSRSLLDFARLIDRFDHKSVSFVSVTQQFNTTTSLGRLTLNILLSFAQFEREIISERTRDKMSAARRKGKWIGGTPMLGYDVHPEGGRLVVNEREACRVREIFELYGKLHSLDAVVAELSRRRWKSKTWKTRKGTEHAGREFTRASLARLLANPVYAGKVEHREQIYPGEQAAIVDPVVWAEFRSELHRPRQEYATRTPQKAMLAGLLFCKHCNAPMIATYTSKRGRRYRYYVCRAARQDRRSCPSKSVPAALIEDSILAQLQAAGVSRDADPSETVRAMVQQIIYDGASGAVSATLANA